jgi:hypothetical protein
VPAFGSVGSAATEARGAGGDAELGELAVVLAESTVGAAAVWDGAALLPGRGLGVQPNAATVSAQQVRASIGRFSVDDVLRQTKFVAAERDAPAA